MLSESSSFMGWITSLAKHFGITDDSSRLLIIVLFIASLILPSMFMAFIEAKTNRVPQAKVTFQGILDTEKITKQQAIAQFRKYFSDRDRYYSFEFYNVLESLKK